MVIRVGGEEGLGGGLVYSGHTFYFLCPTTYLFSFPNLIPFASVCANVFFGRIDERGYRRVAGRNVSNRHAVAESNMASYGHYSKSASC